MKKNRNLLTDIYGFHCCCFFFFLIYNISFSVESAILRQSGLFKPSTYVEVSVDDNPPRKTDVSKNTTHPKWKKDVTILVKPQAKILFKVIDHHNFRKDNVIGEKKLNLLQILQHYNGKCENLELTLGKHDLFILYTHIHGLSNKSKLIKFCKFAFVLHYKDS